MRTNVQWGPLARWHHRILGGFWSLFALASTAILVGHAIGVGRRDWWLALLVGMAYVIVGAGFIRGRKWARWTMGALMVLAGLYFLDMMMMFGFHDNRPGVLYMLIGAGLAGYTLFFLFVSAIWHSP